MIGFITDDNNDIVLDAVGNIKVSEGIDAYRQNMVNRIRLQQYEYPYELTRGINWLGYLLGRNLNVNIWEAQFLQLVNSLPYVKEVLDWRYNIEGNKFLFRLVVNTDLGEIEIKG